mmetsp:Transcript_33863/g.24895  ORF Transcript_33863/g.24895 Transcript_33863/m.24895 type:complete len:204 (-) Transcript_33863:751-1362(-)
MRSFLLLGHHKVTQIQSLHRKRDPILQLVLEVDVVGLESLEAEDEDGGRVVELDLLVRLHVVLAHIAVPRIVLIQPHLLPEVLQAICQTLSSLSDPLLQLTRQRMSVEPHQLLVEELNRILQMSLNQHDLQLKHLPQIITRLLLLHLRITIYRHRILVVPSIGGFSEFGFLLVVFVFEFILRFIEKIVHGELLRVNTLVDELA